MHYFYGRKYNPQRYEESEIQHPRPEQRRHYHEHNPNAYINFIERKKCNCNCVQGIHEDTCPCCERFEKARASYPSDDEEEEMRKRTILRYAECRKKSMCGESEPERKLKKAPKYKARWLTEQKERYVYYTDACDYHESSGICCNCEYYCKNGERIGPCTCGCSTGERGAAPNPGKPRAQGIRPQPQSALRVPPIPTNPHTDDEDSEDVYAHVQQSRNVPQQPLAFGGGPIYDDNAEEYAANEMSRQPRGNPEAGSQYQGQYPTQYYGAGGKPKFHNYGWANREPAIEDNYMRTWNINPRDSTQIYAHTVDRRARAQHFESGKKPSGARSKAPVAGQRAPSPRPGNQAPNSARSQMSSSSTPRKRPVSAQGRIREQPQQPPVERRGSSPAPSPRYVPAPTLPRQTSQQQLKPKSPRVPEVSFANTAPPKRAPTPPPRMQQEDEDSGNESFEKITSFTNFVPHTHEELNPQNYRHLPHYYVEYIKPAGRKTPQSYHTSDCFYMYE